MEINNAWWIIGYFIVGLVIGSAYYLKETNKVGEELFIYSLFGWPLIIPVFGICEWLELLGKVKHKYVHYKARKFCENELSNPLSNSRGKE